MITVLDGAMFESGMESKTFILNYQEGTKWVSWDYIVKNLPAQVEGLTAKVLSNPDVRCYNVNHKIDYNPAAYDLELGFLVEIVWD